MSKQSTAPWPPLPLEAWRDTYATLQMWSQIVGKICLALTPRTNHFWNIAFHYTSRGLVTPLMFHRGRSFTMAFDFIDHALDIACSDGAAERIALRPRTVADFYADVMNTLAKLNLDVHIWTMPVEVPTPIAFDKDTTHKSYDPAYASAFWQALLAMKPTFEIFRAGFLGKCSPVHFFWGSFDLALTRFSGRRAPPRPGADMITRESYSHEEISHGFWPGSGPVQEPAFYAYAAPEPIGLPAAPIQPTAAYYNNELKEFILPYDAIRTSKSPEADLLAFMTSTYTAPADLANWNRAELERS